MNIVCNESHAEMKFEILKTNFQSNSTMYIYDSNSKMCLNIFYSHRG